MKTKHIFVGILAFFLTSCNAQEKKADETSFSDKKNAPKEDIKVNKEYDEDGNLIKYDSTYTFYYSNIDGNAQFEESIYNKFRETFQNQYPFSNESFFDDLFFQDSLMIYDFYKEDFFKERFWKNLEQSEKLFREMDSLKNKFFMEQFQTK